MNMTIAVSANSKYVRYLYIMLCSLFENNSGEEIHVFVLQRDFTDRDKALLLELAEKYCKRIEFVYVDKNRFVDIPETEKFPLEAYFRLMLGEVLPIEIKKVLYIDVDIIIRSNLRELYSIDITDKIAAVCIDQYRPVLDDKKRILFKREDDIRYFNSGVMLLNLNRLRMAYSFADFMKAAEELGYDLQFADQEILNYLIYDQVVYISAEKYNCLVLGDMKEKDLKKNNAQILHYSGCSPWQDGPKNDLYRIWWRYASKTPFYTELLQEQLWRAEGLDSDGNAIGMREMEIKGIYEVAFSLKGKGLISKWLIQNNRKLCIYGAGAMSEVLYELLISEGVWDRVAHVFDKSKEGKIHGVYIENDVEDCEGACMVITPAYKPHEIMEYIKNETKWNREVFLLREFLYKVLQ